MTKIAMQLNNIPFGSLDGFNVLIEISQGSNEKFEYDEESGSIKLDFVFQNLNFPFNYGFILHTLGGDGDALDAIVLSSENVKSGEVVQCKAIGILKTLDRGEVDDKIICVPLSDKLSEKYQDVADLPEGSLEKWTEFYLEVARQKKKKIEIIGFENREVATQEIKKCLQIKQN